MAREPVEYLIRLQPMCDTVPSIVRLRTLLKRAKRDHGLICTDLRQVTTDVESYVDDILERSRETTVASKTPTASPLPAPGDAQDGPIE
jgi:hypothetical protein